MQGARKEGNQKIEKEFSSQGPASKESSFCPCTPFGQEID